MTEEPSSAILRPPPELSGQAVVRAAGRTDLGTKHHVNEDSFAIVETRSGGGFLALCDGMGGMGSGDKASRAALDLLVEWISNDEGGDASSLAKAAVRQADLTVMRSFEAKDGRKPGTTCACVVLRGGLAHMFWVGDSSVLLIRDGRVAHRSRPHRMVQDLIDSGSMTEEQAMTSPMRHYLSRSLGGRDEGDPVEPEVRPPVPLLLGDCFVLCSDGLTDFVQLAEIAEIVSQEDDPGRAADALVKLALEREVDDNVTCIVARVAAEGQGGADVLGASWDLGSVSFDLDEDYGSDIRERPQNLDVRTGDVSSFVGPRPARSIVTWALPVAVAGLAVLILLCVVFLSVLLVQ